MMSEPEAPLCLVCLTKPPAVNLSLSGLFFCLACLTDFMSDKSLREIQLFIYYLLYDELPKVNFF